MPLSPAVGALNTTGTPAIGFPALSKTVTCKGAPKHRQDDGALHELHRWAVIVEGVPAVIRNGLLVAELTVRGAGV